MSAETNFTLNGASVKTAALPASRLSDVLRDEFSATGTKIGCNAGDCGACTVLLNGEAVCACMVPLAQAEAANVETIEGLKANGSLNDLQEAFIHFGAAQCGICTPGMLMSAAALLGSHKQPNRDQVEEAMGGVLCRCTGYRKIIDAVLHAGRLNQQPAAPGAGHNVGAAIPRLDGFGKVTGREIFAADIAMDEAVSVKVIRSPHHHSGFTIGDMDQFIADTPGILAVFTARDIPGENRFGVIPGFIDQPVFAETIARFRGEAVAAIAGEADAIAQFCADDFPITWQPLDHALTPQPAMAEDFDRLHQDRPDNILIRGKVTCGSQSDGWAQSVHQAGAAFTTPFIEHAYIEPEAGLAKRVGERIEIHAGTQAPYMDRDEITRILGITPQQVRIVPTGCGGGFGSKLDISLQPYIALAAWKLNRPAKLVYGRSESMQSTTKRHPSQINARIGCDASGQITAMHFTGIFNTGAYASWGPTVANRVPVHASGPYKTPNYLAETTAVLTNCPPAGAFRGFGVPQSAIAQECLYDELAEKCGLDRLKFRLYNALKNGTPTVTGQVFETGVGIHECLSALEPHWKRAVEQTGDFNRANSGYRRGVGVASCWYGCGNTSLPNPSTIRIGITAQGAIKLHQGAADIGQGSNTVIAQIAADALGIPVHRFELIGGDTDLTPDAGKTSASRQTYVTGSAAKRAGEALRAQILRLANVSANAEIEIGAGVIHVEENGHNSEIRLQTLPQNSHGYVLSAEETYDPPTRPLDENGQGIPYAVFGYGAQMMELEVDTRLGLVRLIKLTAAHDVGRAINPLLVEGQIEGGAAQGIGMALMEEYVPGRTENLHDYLIPTCGDMPEVESIIIEATDAEGPYGAKGLGEHVLIPTAPAILNAIHHATGAWVRDLPATPDKILAAITTQRTGL